MALQVLDSTCDTSASFSSQLSTSLAALLSLLEVHRELARLLTTKSAATTGLGDTELLWRRRFADLLAGLAARFQGLLRHPYPIELFLVSGSAHLIGRELRNHHEDRWAPTLLPDLLEFLLPFYLTPDQCAAVLWSHRASA